MGGGAQQPERLRERTSGSASAASNGVPAREVHAHSKELVRLRTCAVVVVVVVLSVHKDI